MDISNQLTLYVAVGTTNSCKLRAVEIALQRCINQSCGQELHLHVKGYNVDSGVSNQPWDDEETKRGAMNRARNAYFYYDRLKEKDHESVTESHPDIAVGIEGGLEWQKSDQCDDSHSMLLPEQLYCMAWIAIYGERTWLTKTFFDVANVLDSGEAISSKAIFGLSKTALFRLPPSLSTLIEQGIELGLADDILFDRVNSKHSSGTVGLLTNSLIDRSAFYEHAIVLALIPWMQPSLYPDGHGATVCNSRTKPVEPMTVK